MGGGATRQGHRHDPTPDVDCGPIQALLLTFFSLHAPRLVERGKSTSRSRALQGEVPCRVKGKPQRRLLLPGRRPSWKKKKSSDS